MIVCPSRIIFYDNLITIVPKLSDVINYTISVVNVTHVAVTFKAKVSYNHITCIYISLMYYSLL